MKKIIVSFMLMSLFACAQAEEVKEIEEIEELIIVVVPFYDAESIETVMEPVEIQLKENLLELGFNVKDVEFRVTTSYGAAGEALAAGSADVGMISGPTYVDFSEDGLEVILQSLRGNMSIDSEDPMDWNTGEITTRDDANPVSYTRGLIYVGPSIKGKEIYQKFLVDTLVYEDLEAANWCYSASVTSTTGYVFPTLWLYEKYGKLLSDLPNSILMNNNGDVPVNLAQGNCDVAVSYAFLRSDYVDPWKQELAQTTEIFDAVKVIGVTPKISNGAVVVSWNSPKMSEGLKLAVQEAFLHIADTAEGKEAIGLYNHLGYQVSEDKDFDELKKAYSLVKGK
jgi:phosphonate transport system substrate-binding protein